jgi:DNA-binding SARP family transcriptional activator
MPAGPDRGATALNSTRARVVTGCPPATRGRGSSRASTGGDPRWSIGIVAGIAAIELAAILDTFVLRPLLAHGDPRGVIRVAVIVGAFALAAHLRRVQAHLPVDVTENGDRQSAPARTVEAAPATATSSGRPLRAARTPPPPAEVEVQVLGPIAIRGAAHPLTVKSVELVAYLACHPEGIHEERIKAALWPAREPRPQTWLNRVSTTRKGLGCSGGGAPFLPRFDRHVGRLDAAVRTDVEALVAARAQAVHESPSDAVGMLAQALELVRGRPFDAPTGYEWAFTELHVAHAERVIVDVAHELATVALTVGDWRRALWATDIGLRACPGSEQLYQDRMRAAAAGGDRGGIESAMRDLRRTLATADSSDMPSRDTVELAEHLHARLRNGAPTDAGRGGSQAV